MVLHLFLKLIQTILKFPSELPINTLHFGGQTMSSNFKSSDKIRRERNAELLRRMKNGEVLTSYESAASWFPPRPIIEKDRRAIERLYGSNAQPIDTVANTSEPAQEGSVEVFPLRRAN